MTGQREAYRMSWTVTLEHDGHPMATRVPIDDWDLATLIAPLFNLMAGSRLTSVSRAVHAHRTTEAA